MQTSATKVESKVEIKVSTGANEEEEESKDEVSARPGDSGYFNEE